MQAKKKLKTGKVLPFKRNAEFYYDMAEAAISKSDFEVALRSLFHCVNLESDNIDYRIRLAEVYTMLEQYDVSNNIYFDIYADDKSAIDIFYGIGQNFYYDNNLDAALYYLNTYAAASIEPEEADEVIRLFEENVEFDEAVNYRIIHPEKPPDEDDLGAARSLVKQRNYMEAAEIYRAALAADPGNRAAKNNLSMVLRLSEKYKEAEETALSALEAEEDNIFALCSLCLIYNDEGKKAKKEKALKRLLAIPAEEASDLYKIAAMLCEIGEHKKAAEYLSRVQRLKPYDAGIIMLAALAEYNSGNFEASQKYFVKMLRLFERDHVCEYYINLIKDIKNGAEDYPACLAYSVALPPDETERRLRLLASYSGLSAQELNEKWRGEDLYPLCDWAIKYCNDDVAATVICLVGLITEPDAKRYLKSLLINVNTSNILRREIIKVLTEHGEKKRIDYLYDDIFTTVSPKHPKGLSLMPHAFTEAFASAFSVLCFVTERFEARLRRTVEDAVKNVLRKAEDAEKLSDARALAAVLCFKAGFKNLMGKKAFLCEIFETNIKTFNRYLIALG